MNSAASHPARFWSMWPMLISMYGSSSASMPPNFWTSSVVSATSASITSSTVTMPSTRPSVSTTGTARRSYLEIMRATSSRSVRGVTVSTLRVLAKE